MTLNLNKDGKLKDYIEKRICKGLSITIDNVYATNVFKYFYLSPPADTMEILYEHLEENLKLLKEELLPYKDIPIITLGEPVLKLLSKTDYDMKYYWDFDNKETETNRKFNYCKTENSKIGRPFFPFIHQPSMRKGFYKETLQAYVEYMNGKI